MARSQYAIARRSIWYLLRTLLTIALIAVLCLGVFVTAMHISSVYILVTEGLELRAGYILQQDAEDLATLSEYFTPEFVAKDPALYDGTYGHYKVTNFLYNLRVQRLFVLPWEKKATVRVYEDMLSVSASLKDDAPEGTTFTDWVPAIYSVEVTKVDGRWYISDMRLIQQNPAEAVLPTPDYSLLPSPTPEA